MNTIKEKKSFGFRNIEIVFWVLIPVSMIIYSFSKYGIDYMKENPEFIIQFFYGAFPTFFAVMSKFIYNDYPVSAIIESFKKNKKKKQEED